MAKEDRELVDAVQNWRPSEQLHPIVGEAVALYHGSGETLTDEGIETLRGQLDALKEDLKELAVAMETMTRFIILLREKYEDPDSAERVVELLRGYAPLFKPFWKRVFEAFEAVGQDARKAFLQFAGEEEEKNAPAPGQKAPDGSVRLSNLVPPGRPPPWSKKDKK